MDDKDLSLLEFPRICELVARYTSFSLSRKAALALAPSSNFTEVEAGLAHSAEARCLLAIEPSVSLSGIEDIVSSVQAAARGKILDTSTLNAVRLSLEVTRDLRDKVLRHIEQLPQLAGIAVRITPQKSLEKAISRAVSRDGELLPDASDRLVSIRHNQRLQRAELAEKLQSYINSDAHRRFIQEPIITEREGRFVIAVKSEFRGEVKGIVHDISNSGASVFIEPWQTLELGNSVKELQIEEEREIERILAGLSAAVGGVCEDIATGIEAAAAIDLALAKARFAVHFSATEARIYRPSETAPPWIHLEDARHPLLGEAAVPINLDLGREYSVLVITGPNTGGKTVCLKTIGLLCAMTQAGLPVPAAPSSRLPVLDGIYADIGDEQSILQTLSTFGWHMGNISRIFNVARGYNLVLLDELGASTDPQEGSALARAILLYMLQKRFLAAVTTHYTELKVFAHLTPGLENASFDFDPRTLTPTFHLTLGVPGGSNAIATAAHFGLPPEVISNARASMSENSQQLEPLLASLQAEKQHLADLNTELMREKNMLESQNERLAAQLKELQDEKQAMIRSARDEIVAEVAALQKDIKQASAELKKKASRESVSHARESYKRVRERLGADIFAKQTQQLVAENEGEIAPGDIVWLRPYDVKGTVTALDPENGRAEVVAGALRFNAALNDILKLPGEKTENSHVVKLHTAVKSVPIEFDLRGRRAEEIEPLLDSYLSDATIAHLPWVRIIHGFGTGALRNSVREMAGRHPLVRAFRSAGQSEGGDGATIIMLK